MADDNKYQNNDNDKNINNMTTEEIAKEMSRGDYKQNSLTPPQDNKDNKQKGK